MMGPAVKRVAATLALSAVGAAAIVAHEGNINRVYLDPVNIPTVCAGHTSTVTAADVGKLFTREECAQLLASDSAAAQADVRRLVTVPVTQAQYDALVSFTFNVGGKALAGSTLLRKANAGDCWAAGREFSRWTMAGGKHWPGLVKRRAAERASWESGCR